MSQCPTDKVRHLEKQYQYNNKKRKVLFFIGTVGHFDLVNWFNCIKSVHKLFLLRDYWDTRYYFARMKSHPNEFAAPVL